MSDHLTSVPDTTFVERIKVLDGALPLYEAMFDKHILERQRLLDSGEIEEGRFNEEIWFEKVTLELNPYPSLSLVDHYLKPVTGPRLELHLRGRIGIQAARLQMGRIARYIDARNLSEEFPDISAISYVQLALAAEAITHMPPAIYIHTPTIVSQDALDRVEGSFYSYKKFMKRHGKKGKVRDFRLRGQTVPTTDFAEIWRDYVG